MFFQMYLRRKKHLALTCERSLGLCTLPGLVKHAHRLQCLLLQHMLWAFSQLAAERMIRTVTSIEQNCIISYLLFQFIFYAFGNHDLTLLFCAPSLTVTGVLYCCMKFFRVAQKKFNSLRFPYALITEVINQSLGVFLTNRCLIFIHQAQCIKVSTVSEPTIIMDTKDS